MQFKDIIGHEVIKKRLTDTVNKNRISHAQLFLGNEGSGKLSLAVAYAQFINCTNRSEKDSCGECKSCKKYNNLAHPDLHFVYPVVRTPKLSKPVSVDFIKQWRDFLKNNKYLSYSDWIATIGTNNLQGSIYTQESQEIIRIVNLKTFEAAYKVLIIYLPEKMNISTSNKLLKAIEEPPPATLFILVSEDESQIITTIRSRTQLIKINNLTQDEVIQVLKTEVSEVPHDKLIDAAKIANGNVVYAKQIVDEDQNRSEKKDNNFEYFVKFMRLSFSLNFSEILPFVEQLSKLDRENQKKFVEYSQRLLRENFILQQQISNKKINYLTQKEAEFSKNFKKFISTNNIFQLFEEFNKAHFDLTRNASSKILFLDLSLKISRLLRQK